MSESKTQICEKINSVKEKYILVIGDVMLDRYLVGNINRRNPEADVPLVDMNEEHNRLGGAANVSLNLKSLGINPITVGLVNESDTDGKLFLEELSYRNISSEGLVFSSYRKTTTKIRVYANDKYLLRYDREDNFEASEPEISLIHHKINYLFGKYNFIAVIFEDYDKGCIIKSIIDYVIAYTTQLQIPVFVDPKFRNFFKYEDVTVFKPNLKELNLGLNINISAGEEDKLKKAILHLKTKMPHKNTLVTLAERGMLLLDEEDNFYHFETRPRNIKDVSGAGDTVIATLSVAMVAGLDVKTACKLANLAGGLVCEQVGIRPVTLEEIIESI